VLNDLPVLTGAARHAEALWAKEINMSLLDKAAETSQSLAKHCHLPMANATP